MRKRAAGTPVQVVIATDGRYWPPLGTLSPDALAEMREKEGRQAAAILGLSTENIVFLRLEEGRLADHRRFLRDRLADIID
jgi:LmbE family N-acetylglucosaminyl deacetylase